MTLDYNDMPLVLGSNSYTSFGEALHDNIRVVETREIIWNVVQAFGIAFAKGDALFNEFDEQELWDALNAAGGDWKAFMAILDPPVFAGEPRMRVVSVERENPVTLTLANLGSAPWKGSSRVSVGPAYDPTWIAESDLIFHEEVIDGLEARPGEQIELTFELPEVPAEVLDAFQARLSGIWDGYEDKAPETDFFSFVIDAGGERPIYAFLPME